MTCVTKKFYHKYATFGEDAVCHIQVIGGGGARPVVLCSELADNPGPSVTNSAEHLQASLSMRLLGDPLIPPGKPPLFVEHYDCATVYGQDDNEVTYDQVYLNESGAHWVRFKDLDELARVSGYPPEDFLVDPSKLICPVELRRRA